jgi:transcriptional regulator with XRE-family HTH domain
MGRINIGTLVAAKRKEKGLTQEELATYLGVSKPAVSKWESGQSYPDILMLPVLASFFNTTVDELLGYEAQMTKEEARRLYVRLSEAFAAEPFDKVRQECRETIRKYRSCWHLLFSMAQLYVNHSMLAGSPEMTAEVIREASGLLESVEKESGDARLAKEALSLRAYCCLMLGDASAAIDLLDDCDEQALAPGPVLAKAYILKGDRDRAVGLLQQFVFHSIVGAFAAVPDLMTLHADDPEKMEAWLRLALEAGAVVDLRQVQPHHYFTLYLTAAGLFTAAGETDRALDMLESYTDIATDRATYPLRLKGGDLFDRLEAYYNTKNLGTGAPRSEKLIKKDLREIVLHNPTFAALHENARFRRLAGRLEQLD